MGSPTASPTRLQLVISCHQPIARGPAQLEQLWDQGYGPLLTLVLESGVKAALHLSGHLLDFVAARREDTLLSIKSMAKERRVEILSGLFYGAIPALLPELDLRGQIQMMGEFWESALGFAPQGFFLPYLAWSKELPRELEECGLAYGFASSTQVRGELGRHRGLFTVERGEQRVAAFLLDAELSNTFAAASPEAWIAAASERSRAQGGGAISVWLPAERLFTPAGELKDPSSLRALLSALNGTRPEIATVLPAESIATVRPAVPVQLSDRPAAEVGVGVEDWTDPLFRSVALDTLHRRTLLVSEKLRDAIATMEDEELDDTWSDALATAQRLLFAAQAPDAYLCTGGAPSAEDVAAAMSRLVRADAMIDALVQGEEDWIVTVEQDADGDLEDEIFITSQKLCAWLLPKQGGLVRLLEHRALAHAPLLAGQNEPSSNNSGAPLTREWILDAPPSAEELYSGRVSTLWPDGAPLRLVANAVDEQGDCSFCLALEGEATLIGSGDRRARMEKRITIPIDAAEIRVNYKLALGDGPEVAMVCSWPLTLGAPITKLVADGQPVDAEVTELAATQVLRLEGADARAVELRATPACGLRLRRASDSALFVAAVVLVEGEAQWTLTLAVMGEAAVVAPRAAPPSDEAESS